jgi:hypothetical protein
MIRAIALAALWLAGVPALAQPRFQLDPGLDAARTSATRALLEQVQARLPARWQRGLPATLSLQWRADLPEGVHGRVRGDTILLEQGLLDAWLAQAGEARAAPADAPQALQAALIHELAHLYDRRGRMRLSADPRLLDLAGWQKAVLRPGRRANAMRDRSPDLYELHSPREFVAVNLEHYLLDPHYRCRRPDLAAFFDLHFEVAAAVTCPAALPFVDDRSDGQAPVQAIDPARVYAIDYLFAEANQAPMSRWGHSMLRLVVCAPGRTPGPDCRLDLQHHRVLSFRAFVDDLQISSWRGLSGGYPSRLFTLPLDQVVEEYTRVELRGLRALPLALSAQERAAVLARAAQMHWSYDGRYWFVSNNCAVETWRLLHDAVPRLAALPLASVTPNGLLRRLQRQGVIDTQAMPEDGGEQVRLGFHFQSAATHHGTLYALARNALGLAAGDVQAWLALPPSSRRAQMQGADLRTSAALLVLESAALRREQARARDWLKRHWLDRGGPAPDADLEQALEDYLQGSRAFARPAAWLEGMAGYGLPQAQELGRVVEQADAHGRRRQADMQALEAGLRMRLPVARQQALAAVQDNLDWLSARLRQQAAETEEAPQAPLPG